MNGNRQARPTLITGGAGFVGTNLAHRLLAEGRTTGLYFALPTMATANAMFRRIEEVAPRLYAETARPSLTLAHGRAHLHPRFRRTLDAIAAPEGRPGAGEEADSALAASDWLTSESR